MDTSIRSYLVAGMAAATASVIVATPIQPAPAIARAAHTFALSAAVQPLIAPLQTAAVAIGAVTQNVQPTAAATAAATTSSAAATALPTAPGWTPPSLSGQSIGNAIINIYNTLEPWVQWGFEVVAWAASWVVGALADQINIIYNSIEPVVAGVVYSVAYLFDGDFSLILPTLVTGVQTGVQNLVYGEIAWVLSFFPPLPPIGSVFGAAVPAAASTTAAAATSATDQQADTAAPADPISTGHFAVVRNPAKGPRDEVPTAAAEAVPAQAPAVAAEDGVPSGNATADSVTGAPAPDVDPPASSPAPDPDSANATATSDRGATTPHRATSGTGKATGKSARAERSAAPAKKH